MQSGNPTLTENVFKNFEYATPTSMTLGGTAIKTAILLGLCVLSASFVWTPSLAEFAGLALIGGTIAGLVLAIATTIKPSWAPVTAPLYALAEGAALGAISLFFNASYPGIAFQAMGLTFSVLAGLLAVYSTGLVRPTENFKLGIMAATGGIALFYLVAMVLGFFHVQIPGVFDSGWVGIGFSLFVVVIAALNLVLDFDFIQTGVEQRAPRYMEWYGAFALMVTLVWLYMEILRLLAKLRSRD
ncbi:MAG: Bax inhibitor-1/YccA family protein [Planctomycetes bacterium]|nr:Bax inhibitor-1/YccA family protein [Planctomycetota bacterium]